MSRLNVDAPLNKLDISVTAEVSQVVIDTTASGVVPLLVAKSSNPSDDGSKAYPTACLIFSSLATKMDSPYSPDSPDSPDSPVG